MRKGRDEVPSRGLGLGFEGAEFGRAELQVREVRVSGFEGAEMRNEKRLLNMH